VKLHVLLSVAPQAVQNHVRECAERLTVNADGVEREFFVSFVNVPRVSRLRLLKSNDLGKLVSFTGKGGGPRSWTSWPL
jgi:DNA replicative helicase MCM subunit Mcm2 (Cdc46/Mcm family)